MPEWLLSVISGILAGGIPGFRIEHCCFFDPFVWPLYILLLFCFIFGGHSHDNAQDVIVQLMPQSWQWSHFSVLCGFGFLFVLCAFCLVYFVCGLVFDGIAQWIVYRSITSARLRLLTFRRHCMIIYNSFFCCDWTRVTTWREPWRHWTEKKKSNDAVILRPRYNSLNQYSLRNMK